MISLIVSILLLTYLSAIVLAFGYYLSYTLPKLVKDVKIRALLQELETRPVSDEEWSNFFEAVYKLKKYSSSSSREPKEGAQKLGFYQLMLQSGLRPERLKKALAE